MKTSHPTTSQLVNITTKLITLNYSILSLIPKVPLLSSHNATLISISLNFPQFITVSMLFKNANFKLSSKTQDNL